MRCVAQRISIQHTQPRFDHAVEDGIGDIVLQSTMDIWDILDPLSLTLDWVIEELVYPD
jgi:hypothetical protein